MDAVVTLKAEDFEKVELLKSGYYWESGYNEHTLRCELQGKGVELEYTLWRHDDGYGFTIHSKGTEKDIWESMPERELEKLEDVLSYAVAFGEWKRRIDEARTKEDVLDVRYCLFDDESGRLSREHIQKLHAMIDKKESEFNAARKRSKNSR